MPLDFDKLNQDVKNTQVKVVLTHLAAGLTFASLAGKAEADEDRATARKNARTAYNSALHFVGRVTMTPREAQEVRKDMETLKRRLEELGEMF